jgi:hypothetical protein
MRSIYQQPGFYLIRVAGCLDAQRADRLGGMTVSQATPATQTDAAVVELTGCLADQAALNGVLNTLYDYHYPVLRVEYLGPANES